MACIPCQQNRQAYVDAWRDRSARQAAAAVTRSVAIMTDKMRGVDVNRKYGLPPVIRSPYRGPPRIR
jgi:hypothetical protein